MRIKGYVFILLITLSLSGLSACVPVGEGVEIPFGEEFRIEYGQTVTLEDGIELKFLELKREARCPEDAICTWKGEAIIAVAIGYEDEVGTVVELEIPGNVDSFSSEGHRYKDHRSYRLSLRQLDPYPLVDHVETKHRYVARVLVEKVDDEEQPVGNSSSID